MRDRVQAPDAAAGRLSRCHRRSQSQLSSLTARTAIWDDAFPGFRRVEPDERYPDASQTTTLSERERRRAAARELGAAIAARDTAAAVELWETSRTVPETATYAAAVHLLVSRDAAAAIERALRRKDDDGLVAAVAEAERAGVAPSTEARTAVRAARQRITARIALREAIGQRRLLRLLPVWPARVRSIASVVWSRRRLARSSERSPGQQWNEPW